MLLLLYALARIVLYYVDDSTSILLLLLGWPAEHELSALINQNKSPYTKENLIRTVRIYLSFCVVKSTTTAARPIIVLLFTAAFICSINRDIGLPIVWSDLLSLPVCRVVVVVVVVLTLTL